MIERTVRLQDGTMADSHEVWYITHDAQAQTTTVHCLHYRAGEAQTSTSHEFELCDGLTFAEAEEWVADLPEMAEEADERDALLADMAALLTDEQIAAFSERLESVGLAEKVATARLPDAGILPIRPGKGTTI